MFTCRKLFAVSLVAITSLFMTGNASFAAPTIVSETTSQDQTDLFSKEMQFDPCPLIWNRIKQEFTNTNFLSTDNLISWIMLFVFLGVGILGWVVYQEKVKKHQDN